VTVKEGQQVDRRHPVPDRSGAVPACVGPGARQARRRQGQPQQSVANVALYSQTLEIVNSGIALKQRDVERKNSLVKSQAGSQLDLDNTPLHWSPRRRSGSS
jgi:membrane fusion protein (multidrug efflux system)